MNERGTKRYSDLEVEVLIDDISEAAYEAIEQAAAEAVRASALAALEREATLLREAAHQQAEALRWRQEAELRQQVITETKRAGRKNTLLAAVIGVLGGLALGVGGMMLMRN